MDEEKKKNWIGWSVFILTGGNELDTSDEAEWLKNIIVKMCGC